MKNTILFPFLLFVFSFFDFGKINAQYLEMGMSAGAANYLGDLAPSKVFTSVGDSRFVYGALVRYNCNDWLTMRASFHHGSIIGDDANSNNTENRKKRNLSFQSTIEEFSLMGEINLFGYRPYEKGRSIAPYFFGGLAVFRFNPQAEYEGVWYDLQPLGTEGQGLPGNPAPYALTQVAIPLGAGLKIALSKHLNLGIETGLRKTFTDHLDDVSGTYPDLDLLAETRGPLAAQLSWRSGELNPDANAPLAGNGRGDAADLDWYLFSGVTLSYNFINTGNRGSRNAKKLKCPRF